MSNRVPAELAVVLSNTVVEVSKVVVVRWSVFLLVAVACVVLNVVVVVVPLELAVVLLVSKVVVVSYAVVVLLVVLNVVVVVLLDAVLLELAVLCEVSNAVVVFAWMLCFYL